MKPAHPEGFSVDSSKNLTALASNDSGEAEELKPPSAGFASASALRREYFCRMHPTFAAAKLDSVVSDSEGFSFAQLREAYIMAGQLAFEGNREIVVKDLSSGVRSLRETFQFGQHLRNTDQKSFSRAVNLGRGCRVLKIASCWRRARFSRSKSRWEHAMRATSPKKNRNMEMVLASNRMNKSSLRLASTRPLTPFCPYGRLSPKPKISNAG